MCVPDWIPAKTQKAPLSSCTGEDARPWRVEHQQLTPRLQVEGASFDPGVSGAGAGCHGHSATLSLSRCSCSDNKPKGEDSGPDLPAARCLGPCSSILRPGLGPGNAATEERGPLSRLPSQHQLRPMSRPADLCGWSRQPATPPPQIFPLHPRDQFSQGIAF